MALSRAFYLGCFVAWGCSSTNARETEQVSAASESPIRAAEATWGIDIRGLDCELGDGEVLRCACPGPAACEAQLNTVDGRSESYTAGRGERAWSSHFTRGDSSVYVFGDPVEHFEIHLRSTRVND